LSHQKLSAGYQTLLGNAMENPYLPPKSEVSDRADDREEKPYFPKRTMRISMVIIASLDTAYALYGYFVSGRYDLPYTASSCATIFMLSWFLVVVIHKMANGHGSNGNVRKLGIWGFVWRSYIARYVSLIPTFFIFSAFNTASVSIENMLIATTIVALVIPATVWALFSNDRQAKIQWIFATLPRF